MKKEVIIHVLVPIMTACILNAYIYIRGWDSQSYKSRTLQPGNKYLPPGYIIAIVWIIILGLLGYTHYLVYPSAASYTIIFAILYCLAYPFLTSGLQASKADVYNALSFIIATIVFIMVYMQKHEAFVYVIPFVLWTSYVNVVT